MWSSEEVVCGLI